MDTGAGKIVSTDNERKIRCLHRIFEQLVTPLAFATVVPAITIGATSEWLFGVPINLISGHLYWWVAEMSGELGRPWA